MPRPNESSVPLAAFVRPGTFPITRVVRNMRVARRQGYDVLYVGARRGEDIPVHDSWEGFDIERVGMAWPLLGGRRAYLYLVGVAAFALAATWKLIKLRPKVVHASDVEGMLGCLVYRTLFRNSSLLFNVHDNMPQRYRCPEWTKTILRAFEGLISKFADEIILPDERRVSAMGAWAPSDPVLVPNTPEDPGTPAPMPGGPLKLLLVGWLDRARGVDTAAALLDRLPDAELIVAGDGPADVVDQIKGLPRTTYHGFIKHEEVFSLAAGCHVFLALYDPSSEINRNASPNKVGDALACGRPLVINAEVAVAPSLAAAGTAFAVPYDDVDALAVELRAFADSPERQRDMSENARRHYEREYDWQNFEPHIEAIFPKHAASVETSRRLAA